MSSNKTLFDPNKKQEIVREESETLLLKKLFQEIVKEERRLDSAKSFEFEARLKLDEKYDSLYQKDMRLVAKYDIEGRKWKYLVYQLISTHRNKLKAGSLKDTLGEWKEYFHQVLDSYSLLRDKLIEKDVKPSMYAKTYLRQGDVCRYLASLIVDEDSKSEYWSRSKSFYLEYASLVPANALVWNQLAIAHAAEKMYLLAIKNYLYALTVPKPFENAKEALLELFHVSFEASLQSSMMIPTLNDPILLKFEKVFVRIVTTLFTKIAIDRFQHDLEELTLLCQQLDVLYQLNPVTQSQWWYDLAFILISTACTNLRNPTFDEAARNVLLSKSFDVMFVLVTFGMIKAPDSCTVELFLVMMLQWITVCGSPDPFRGEFQVTWDLLLQKYSVVTVEGDSVDAILSFVKKRTGDLPEDGCYRECIPFLAFSSTSSDWNDVLKHCEQRRTRIGMLLGYLQPRISPSPMKPTAAVSSTPKTMERQREFAFSDFEEEEYPEESVVAPVLAEMILDDFDDAEESETVKSLKQRKEALQTSLSEKGRERPLTKGESSIVFDTNIIIRSVEPIKRIIESREWKIVFPSAVITELLGIAGNKNPKLSEPAKKIIEYLQDNFDNSLFSVRSMQGTLIPFLGINHEVWSKDIRSADDAILATCQRLPNAFLVTDDRNLRIKAATMGVSSFSQLSKLE
jgi:rRNA-processing protein FCF1